MMNATERLAKADRVAAKLVAEYGKSEDLAQAIALWMVLHGCYKLRKATMSAFLAGPKGAERFRKEIIARWS